MDIVKKNLLSILCGVVALICVILIFYPFGGMYDTLRADVAKSAKVGDNLRSVMGQPRQWPSISALPEDRVPLKDNQGRARFPNESLVAAGRKITGGWTETADRFLKNAIAIQDRQLTPLVRDALPNGGIPARAMFQRVYADKFTVPIDPNTGKKREGANSTIFHEILRGGLPPTEAEIAEAVAATRQRIEDENLRVLGNAATNREEVDAKIAAETVLVADREKQKAATSFSVYVDPAQSILPVTTIAGTSAPGLNEIFNAQVALWIEMEICRAIRETNEGARQGVLDAPIKRLLKLAVQQPYQARAGGGMMAESPTAPLTVPSNPQTKIVMDYKINPLGHQSNELYDVATFDLEIICEAESVPRTLTGLARGRYISFQKVHTVSVDSATHAAAGFLYGSKPVVQLNIRGQYLILRRVIGKYMPPDVIRGLNPAAAPAPGF
jgi:hypothetical protein